MLLLFAQRTQSQSDTRQWLVAVAGWLTMSGASNMIIILRKNYKSLGRNIITVCEGVQLIWNRDATKAAATTTDG